ncbi:hypothetical protein [Gracilibacillus dipsosauri]|uniref:hypothetical protein n=1 Tax=Gracilibacillus dipsosauri TaxID=178340 RepID=UPI002409A587
MLEQVLGSSKQVVAVTPEIVGENTDNASNNEIKELNVFIRSITCKHANISFLDMQSFFCTFQNLPLQII